MQVTYPAPIPQPTWSVDDLPRTVACSLSHGSNVTSMDFHPTRHTLLLGMTKITVLFDYLIYKMWYALFHVTYVNPKLAYTSISSFLTLCFTTQWDLLMVNLHFMRLVCVKHYFQSPSKFGI